MAKYFNEHKIINQSIVALCLYQYLQGTKSDFNNDWTTTGLMVGILNGSGWIIIISHS